MEKIQTHVFDNGLPAVYLSSPTSRVLSAILLVGVGSRFETAQTQGLARFYANICFQGSQQRPSKKKLWQALDELGLTVRPTIYPEYSLFYFSSIKKNFRPSLKLFLNIFFQPSLTAKGLAAEKKLTLTEIDQNGKTPQFIGLDKLNSDIFNNSSLGFNILGERSSIEKINLDRLKRFQSKYYVSQNCLLLITGPAEEFPLDSLAGDVAIIPQGQRQPLPAFDFSQTKTTQEKISHLGGFSYLTFAALCFGRNSAKRIAQSLLINLLSQGRANQRLKKLSREKVVNSVKPWIKTFNDCGLFLVQATTPSTKEKQAREEILRLLTKMEPITEEELNQAKNYYQNNLLIRLDNSLELGLFYGLGYFFNLEEQTPEEVIAKIEKVTLEEINKISQTIFRPETISSVVVGPGY